MYGDAAAARAFHDGLRVLLPVARLARMSAAALDEVRPVRATMGISASLRPGGPDRPDARPPGRRAVGDGNTFVRMCVAWGCGGLGGAWRAHALRLPMIRVEPTSCRTLKMDQSGRENRPTIQALAPP